MPDPFPLVHPRPRHVKKPLDSLPPPRPGWLPVNWESDDWPVNDSPAAFEQWLASRLDMLPRMEAIWRRLPQRNRWGQSLGGKEANVAGRIVRDAYRLTQRLHAQGTLQSAANAQPGQTYTLHDAELIVQQLLDQLKAVTPTSTGTSRPAPTRTSKGNVPVGQPAASSWQRGPLGLEVNENNHAIRRKGKTAEFNGMGKAWDVFDCLRKRHPALYRTTDLGRDAWGHEVDDNSVHKQTGAVRELLEPLGVTVKHTRPIGYVLTALAGQPADRGRAKKRGRQKGKRTRKP
jgi:hypothetical protein